jgi:hypothetical protein
LRDKNKIKNPKDQKNKGISTEIHGDSFLKTHESIGEPS